MSSHHFVKEGQEPALYVHEAITFARVGSLLEWAPLVITRSSQLEQVLAWGIKVDVILLEGGYSEMNDLIENQQPVRLLDAGGNPLAALKLLLTGEGQANVSIITHDARTLISDMWSPSEGHSLTIVDLQSRWVAVRHRKFTKWFPKNSDLYLLPSRINFQVEGAIINNADLKVVNDGLVTIASSEFFWLGENS